MRWGIFARPCISPGLRSIAIWRCRRDNQRFQGEKLGGGSSTEEQWIRCTSLDTRGKDAVVSRRLSLQRLSDCLTLILTADCQATDSAACAFGGPVASPSKDLPVLDGSDGLKTRPFHGHILSSFGSSFDSAQLLWSQMVLVPYAFGLEPLRSYMLRREHSPNIRRALDWFLSFLEPAEWSARKESIEEYLEKILPIQSSRQEASMEGPISVSFDLMGWYLYLAETALTAPEKYEPIQGSRVLPIFERLGADFDHLTRIEGIDEKSKQLVRDDPGRADSTLFEILVALLWKRNGWTSVQFFPESPEEKRPDIIASSRDHVWAIECKRMSKTSGYSHRERTKWHRLWRHLGDLLAERRLDIILDIVFHVELETLADEFIVDELAGKLPLVASYPSHIISNDVWDVRVSRATLEQANRYLKDSCVKWPSDQLIELIAGRRDPNRGFTCVIRGKLVSMGSGRGSNRFIDSMNFAAGAFLGMRCRPGN